MLKIVKGPREGFCYSIYIRHMRMLIPTLLVMLGLSACRTDEDTCPANWTLDKRELPVYAAVDSGRLVLSAWNAVSPNAIELSRQRLEGDFDLIIDLIGLDRDSLTSPQFRFEVFDLEGDESLVAGLAVNKTVVYAYVGTEADQSDIRLISSHQGTLTITRSEGRMTCRAELGEVVISYSDTLTTNDMGVRLILGATAPSTGKIQAVLDDFVVSGGWTHSQISAPKVWSDYFDCESW